jgi:tripeptide aminopeptidase
MHREILTKRFLDYVSYDTASDANSSSSPSTARQYEFAKVLAQELRDIGLSDVELNEYAYIYATLPSNLDREVPTIGFLAHMDVVADVPSANIKPRIVDNYDGGDIVLNAGMGLVMSPRDFPDLVNYVGQDLITTDGTTLLGSDNKAGIAEIVTAMEYLIKHPEIEHGTVKIAFTPDEEISRGTEHFDVQKFAADFAFTVDAGGMGSIVYETFNAASVRVTVNGKNIHPGAAKNKMKNALLLAMEFNSMLPANERPAHTEGYEGFYHLNNMDGGVETAVMKYILRDHDWNILSERKEVMRAAAAFINKVYGDKTIELEIKDQYRNMAEKIEPVMEIVELARDAMRSLGIEPRTQPMRGGTDGAQLSFKGLPCPNISYGGHNVHGKFEYVPIQSMVKCTEVILKMIELNSR